MRVLWFTNIPMPAMDARLGRVNRGTGWWMSALLDRLVGRPEVNLAVACAFPAARDLEFTENGVDYFLLAQPAPSWWMPWPREDVETGLARCAALAARWKPDLIHVHGSERFYGLLRARGLVSCPLVVSIQGPLRAYSKPWYFGNLSLRDTLRTYGAREWLRAGLWGTYASFARDSRREEEILRGADGVLGRTAWDRAHAWCIAPDVPYHHADEMLRPEFHQGNWRLGSCVPRQLLTVNRLAPYKGVEVLLDAMGPLRREYPDLRLKVVGEGFVNKTNGYARFLRGRIRRLGLSDCVDLLGWIDTPDLVRLMEQSHCYVCASFIENLCNSLSEAMLVGMPCVASFAGGMTTTLEDGRTGLMFPPGDAPLLAERLMRVFRDPDLASGLGRAAQEAARRRHDPQRIVSDLIATYEAVIQPNRAGARPPAPPTEHPRFRRPGRHRAANS